MSAPVRLGSRLDAVVGGRTATVLGEALDLHTVGDLVRHYPRRYAERGKLMPFSDLVVGDHATVFAEVVSSRAVSIRGRAGRGKPLRRTEVSIHDDAGARMSFAIFGKWKAEQDLRPGRRAFFSGKVTLFRGQTQLASPDYVLVDDDAGAVAERFAEALVPVYPVTSALTSDVVESCLGLVLDALDVGADPLPPEVRDAHRLAGLAEALRLVHRPASWADVTRGRQRLVWDEALVLQVVLAQRRRAVEAQPSTPRPGRTGGLLEAFDRTTPFTLTAGQREVGEVLTVELARPHPMHRLLQGEVGSGKTLVALRAMLAVVDSGGQAALLAPTEVLAQQHARSLRALLGPLATAGELGAPDPATQVALLTGSQSAPVRRVQREAVSSGTAGLVVGTHALLAEGVDFADLGLVVVDEQHRFGVEQREALRAKGGSPHVLVMTATPIPRTVAMTVYGDLEVSTLTELPPGRSPVVTHVVPLAEQPAWLGRAWHRIIEAVGQGRQALVVCPRVGAADDPGGSDDQGRSAAAVEQVLPALRDGALAGLRVAALHGQMPTEAKDEAVRLLVEGHTEVLVTTTVIEVGVDVPNATVLVVLDADRFGVSQLHQLRGRIGRGVHPGLCLLVTEAEPGTPARGRVEAVAATTDGFALAQLDLEQRREGDVLGAAQSGTASHLRLLRLSAHEGVLREARVHAAELVAGDPELTRHPALALAVASVLAPDRADYLERS